MVTRSSFECSAMETSRQQNSQRYQQEISHFSRCRNSKQGIHDEFPPKQRDCRQVFLHSFYAIKMSYFLNRKINDGVVFTFLLYVWDLCAKKSSRDGKSLESSLKVWIECLLAQHFPCLHNKLSQNVGNLLCIMCHPRNKFVIEVN